MADVVAVLQSEASLLRCQLHRLDQAIDLNAEGGDVLGIGYYENGRVLLRKRPVSNLPLRLEQLGQDVRSDLFLASWHRAGPNGFREQETAPYRFRNWLFAGKGRLLSAGEHADLVEELPDFLKRGLVQASPHEIAFFTALGQVQREVHALDHLEIDPAVVGRALSRTLLQFGERAARIGAPPPETTAFISNGRMIVAVRRGRPLAYALLEGMTECPVCGIDRETSDRDPRVRAHRTVKAVAVTTRPRKDGVQWIEVPDGHVLMVDRSWAVRIAPIQA